MNEEEEEGARENKCYMCIHDCSLWRWNNLWILYLLCILSEHFALFIFAKQMPFDQPIFGSPRIAVIWQFSLLSHSLCCSRIFRSFNFSSTKMKIYFYFIKCGLNEWQYASFNNYSIRIVIMGMTQTKQTIHSPQLVLLNVVAQRKRERRMKKTSQCIFIKHSMTFGRADFRRDYISN